MTESKHSAGARIVPCPNCKKNALWHADNRWRPFCSERCKLIDLGAWAAGSYVIPGEPAIHDKDSSE